MCARRAEFYGDEEDLTVILNEFTKLGDFKYIEMSSSLNQENKCYKDAIHLLEQEWYTNNIRCMFLVADAHTELISYPIDMVDGSGYKIKINQGLNFETICINLGGTVENNILIASMVDTLGDSDRAKEMHTLFKKVITKHSKKVGDTRVMPSAIEKLKGGWRLTPGLDRPSLRDVKLPE